jgi:hypothetical protein
VQAFVSRAGVTRYSTAFQSRLGRDPWLKPYTDHEIERFAKEGVKKLLVICPAFVSDCLETLEEIGIFPCSGREGPHPDPMSERTPALAASARAPHLQIAFHHPRIVPCSPA